MIKGIKYLKASLLCAKRNGGVAAISRKELPVRLDDPNTSKMIINTTIVSPFKFNKTNTIFNYEIAFISGDKLFNYTENNFVRPDLNNLEMFALDQYSLKKIETPQSDLSGIQNYFVQRPDIENQYFDCCSFILFCKKSRVSIYKNIVNQSKYFNFRSLENNEPAPGQVIGLMKDISIYKNHSHSGMLPVLSYKDFTKDGFMSAHLSIYLGSDIYLAKIGNGEDRPVIAARKDFLELFYKPEAFRIAELKSEF